MIKTLEKCSMMPVESDVWFLNNYTDRDYIIQVSDEPCHECGNEQYVKDEYESYCNYCGKIIKKQSYINKGAYNGFTHDMKVLKNRSTHLKEIETQLKKIEPDYNKKYRDFKYHYYELFLEIADKDYHIDNGTANDLFYSFFRGYYDLNKRQGLKREKIVQEFLDGISINPREYFMAGFPVTIEAQNEYDKPAGSSRNPRISDGQLNVTGKRFTGRRIDYDKYLEDNGFEDTEAIRMKYLKRYSEDYNLSNIKYIFTPEDYDRKSVAEPITTVPTLNEYIPYKSLKYYGTHNNTNNKGKFNLNNYIYTNKPEKKHVEQKTDNDPQKNTENKTGIKTIGGTLITERMNKHPYRDKIYPLKLTICKNCPKSSRLWITKKHRQYLCTYCKQ